MWVGKLSDWAKNYTWPENPETNVAITRAASFENNVEKQSVLIAGKRLLADGGVSVRLLFYPLIDSPQESYLMDKIVVYVQVEGDEERELAIYTNEIPQDIPSYSENPDFLFQIWCSFKLDYMYELTINLNPEAVVTRDSLKDDIGNLTGVELTNAVLKGNSTSVTPGGNDSSTKIATTKFVSDNYMKIGRDYVTAGKKSETVLGNCATAEGYQTTASGDYSHVEGLFSEATGTNSHAEGGAVASGQISHAEGQATVSGYTAHGEGAATVSGRYAHGEGFQAMATGDNSHAEGQNTFARGKNSHVEGTSTEANHLAQHVFGEYNIIDPSTTAATSKGNYIEIVGNGTADNARSNARTLDWSGNEWLAGTLKIGGTGFTDTNAKEVATKEYVDGAVFDSSNIFIATYLTTTYSEISNALSNNKTVILQYPWNPFHIATLAGRWQAYPEAYIFIGFGGTLGQGTITTPFVIDDFTTDASFYMITSDNVWSMKVGLRLNNLAINTMLTAPTAAAGTNTTQVATTAFVNTAITNALANITDILGIEAVYNETTGELSYRLKAVE